MKLIAEDERHAWEKVKCVAPILGFEWRSRTGAFKLSDGRLAWFIHHEEDEEQNETKWENEIVGELIYEGCKTDEETKERCYSALRRFKEVEKVTFVRKDDGKWHFMGVYKLDEGLTRDEERAVYKRVAMEYDTDLLSKQTERESNNYINN